jgi:hypothetical protein
MNARHATLLLASSLLLIACQQETVREIDWAKAALARNPNYEIVATDETAGVFTVRDTATGEVSTLKLNDLVATPRPSRSAAKPAEPATDPAPAQTPPADIEAAEPALADRQTTEPVESGEPVTTGATALASGPGYSISRGTGDKPATSSATLEGPGYKIERQETERKASAPATEPSVAAVERRTDPIICQGNRLMRIDGETIDFTGDAVIAERGCDLYISNARIRAGGVGIIARQQARVHIVNSTIVGTRASYEASDGAELYVARTAFTGVGRRFDGATMTDLGGNSYETH